MVVLLLNWVYIWPHFGDWGKLSDRRQKAESKLSSYQQTVAQTAELQKQVGKYENAGESVPEEDQSINQAS